MSEQLDGYIEKFEREEFVRQNLSGFDKISLQGDEFSTNYSPSHSDIIQNKHEELSFLSDSASSSSEFGEGDRMKKLSSSHSSNFFEPENAIAEVLQEFRKGLNLSGMKRESFTESRNDLSNKSDNADEDEEILQVGKWKLYKKENQLLFKHVETGNTTKEIPRNDLTNLQLVACEAVLNNTMNNNNKTESLLKCKKYLEKIQQQLRVNNDTKNASILHAGLPPSLWEN